MGLDRYFDYEFDGDVESQNALEIELKKVKEELERNDKLIPKTPFALGDEVWVTYRKYNDKGEVKCPMCNGEGYITALTDVYGTLKCVCPHCNRKLINFDMDSQGGRGYKCDCGYQTWVSYKCVDKNFYLNS